MLELSTFEFDVVTVNGKGEEIHRITQTAKHHIENLGDEITMEMVFIPSGSFMMGAPNTEEGWHPNQSPLHRVNLLSFYMSKYPITQAQWLAVATNLPQITHYLDPEPSNFLESDRPVEQISWYDALEFCDRLSQFTNHPYRLPSEAEWEYACRGNTITPFHFGETITTDLANYSGINWEYLGKICNQGFYGQGPLGCDKKETTVVNYFAVANQFGLSDLHGNVKEWCADDWHDNYQDAPKDGSIWLNNRDSNLKVLRGGCWNIGPKRCRSATRFKMPPDASLYDTGFRVVFS